MESSATLPAQRATPSTTLHEVARVAAATDILVFRLVAADRYLQIGGYGRGAGWAGNVALRPSGEPALREAAAGEVVRWSFAEPRPVLGPYHAPSAALVPVDHGVLVLFGARAGAVHPDPGVLTRAARQAVLLVEAVTPAKGLADELELLHAVRAVMQCPATDLPGVLAHVAGVAAAALACEVGLVWLADGEQLAVAERGWSLPGDREELRRALDLAWKDRPGHLPGPLGPDAGVCSHLLVPLGLPAHGGLVVLHTVRNPRGFTDLCREIAAKVAEAAGVLVHASVLREELERLVRQAEATARRDPLTGLANRLGWDEALRVAHDDVQRPGAPPVSVVVVDLNQLKAVNDRHGHAAGDLYLQLGAQTLRAAAREGDVVARLGGDEFGMVLPGCGAGAASQFVTRLRERIAVAGAVAGCRLSASVGVATCPPGGDVISAQYAADQAMYADKIRGRTR